MKKVSFSKTQLLIPIISVSGTVGYYVSGKKKSGIVLGAMSAIIFITLYDLIFTKTN